MCNFLQLIDICCRINIFFPINPLAISIGSSVYFFQVAVRIVKITDFFLYEIIFFGNQPAQSVVSKSYGLRSVFDLSDIAVLVVRYDFPSCLAAAMVLDERQIIRRFIRYKPAASVRTKAPLIRINFAHKNGSVCRFLLQVPSRHPAQRIVLILKRFV